MRPAAEAARGLALAALFWAQSGCAAAGPVDSGAADNRPADKVTIALPAASATTVAKPSASPTASPTAEVGVLSPAAEPRPSRTAAKEPAAAPPPPSPPVVDPPAAKIAVGPHPPSLAASAKALTAGNMAQVIAETDRVLRGMSLAAQPAEWLLAKAYRVSAFRRSGHQGQADKTAAEIITAWSSEPTHLATIEAQHPGAASAAYKVYAADAVARTLFEQAEAKRASVLRLKQPHFGAARRMKAVERFIAGPLKTWLAQRKALQRDAELAYARIANLTSPPPRWLAIAGVRVAAMRIDLVRAMRMAPHPAEWDQPGTTAEGMRWSEIRNIYHRRLYEVMRPQRQAARGALRVCQKSADQHSLSGPFVDSCRQWLAANPAP